MAVLSANSRFGRYAFEIRPLSFEGGQAEARLEDRWMVVELALQWTSQELLCSSRYGRCTVTHAELRVMVDQIRALLQGGIADVDVSPLEPAFRIRISKNDNDFAVSDEAWLIQCSIDMDVLSSGYFTGGGLGVTFRTDADSIIAFVDSLQNEVASLA